MSLNHSSIDGRETSGSCDALADPNLRRKKKRGKADHTPAVTMNTALLSK